MISTQVTADAVKEELGSFFATEAHDDADILLYIQSAIRYIAQYKDFEFLKKREAVVYTTPMVELTTTYKTKTDSVRDIDGHEFDVLGIDDFYSKYRTSNSVGVWSDKFVAPNAGTYYVIYYGVPTFPTALTDTIDLPDSLVDVLNMMSIHYGYKKLRLYEKANAIIPMAQAILNKFSERVTQPRTSSVTSMGRRHRI